jgi:hypothetical protein
MAAGFTEWDASLKEVYDEREVKSLSYADNVALGLFEKKQSGGDYFVQPVHYQGAGGASATLSVAKTNNTSSKIKKLNITRVAHFQKVSIELKLLLAASKKSESFIEAKKEFDFGFEELSAKFDQRLFRSSSGSIGQIKSTTTLASDTIILTDKADTYNFLEGGKIAFSSVDGGGSLRDSGDVVEVEAVDYAAGTVTIVEADLATEIASVATGDYIFYEGDYDACMSGLEDWLPVTNRATKLAASFFGMTRTANTTRLGGVYVDATSLGLDANGILIKLVTDVVMNGSKGRGKPDICLCPWSFFNDLQQIWLDARKGFESVKVSVSETMGDGSTLVISRLYPGMKAMVGGVELTIMPSRHCPTNRLYVLQRNTWTVHHVGRTLPCFPLEEVEGQNMRLNDTTSGQTDLEAMVWLAGYGNLGCSHPGNNGVAKLPTA